MELICLPSRRWCVKNVTFSYAEQNLWWLPTQKTVNSVTNNGVICIAKRRKLKWLKSKLLLQHNPSSHISGWLGVTDLLDFTRHWKPPWEKMMIPWRILHMKKSGHKLIHWKKSTIFYCKVLKKLQNSL